MASGGHFSRQSYHSVPVPRTTPADTGLDHDTCFGQWNVRMYEAMIRLGSFPLGNLKTAMFFYSSHIERLSGRELSGPAAQPEDGPRPTALEELGQLHPGHSGNPSWELRCHAPELNHLHHGFIITAVSGVVKNSCSQNVYQQGRDEGIILHPFYRLECEDHRRKKSYTCPSEYIPSYDKWKTAAL